MNLYEFFDRFGILVFAFLTGEALYSIIKEENRNWRVFVRLAIGVTGFIVDSYLVFFY